MLMMSGGGGLELRCARTAFAPLPALPRPPPPSPAPTPDPRSLYPPGRAGVPMEVMGLMLGEFVDDYTVRVVDVFAMPQSGTGVSVEAVDPVFQQQMLEMLKQTGACVVCVCVRVGWCGAMARCSVCCGCGDCCARVR